jgi:hypothetical protein
MPVAVMPTLGFPAQRQSNHTITSIEVIVKPKLSHSGGTS